MTSPAPAPLPTTPLALTRSGKRTFEAGNGRGDTILVGPEGVAGAFTPGELLKIAVAGCAAMSADHRLAHLLGEDFLATITVVGFKDEAEERYSHYDVTIASPSGGAAEAEIERTVERALHLIEKNCTVGRTLDRATPHHVTIDLA